MPKLNALLCSLLMMSAAAPALAAYPDDLKLTTWNTMLLPRSAFPNYGQAERARQIATAPVLNGQDVVVLQELFDNEVSESLLAGLKSRFPYQTPVIGRSKAGWDRTEGVWRDALPEDGGAAIVSRWPIVEKSQYLYKTIGCGDDFPALKGFAYAKLNVNGAFYHVIGTHLQSESSWGCNAAGGHAAIRQAQLREISDWIRQKQIPASEMVLIAGDFNINKLNGAEYQAMLSTLNAVPPRYVGVPYSFDTQKNGIALERYGARSGDPVEYLDYVLVEKSHRQPSVWHNLAIDPPSAQWTVQDAVNKRTYAYTDYSDHYPVMAFAHADAGTPTRSYVDQNGSYRQVGLQNVGNGRWVQSATAADGWLKTDAATSGALTSFNLSNNFAMRDNGCIRSGEYVRIERADRPGWFWTWWGVAGGNQYSYYTKQGPLTADPELRLVNLSNPNGCLKDGDTVALKDWARAADYYVSAWSGGGYNDRLYLWFPTISANEQFRVRIQGVPQRLDWSGQLVYGKALR